MSVLDLTTGAFKDFFGGRGACGTFTMPSNGLLYQIPDACTCYPKINQYAAYSPESAFDRAEKAELDIGRLVKGPAYGKVMHSRPPANRDWPTFRGDAKRSGSNASKLSAGLTEQWRQDFGEAVTSPVISEGTLFVALPESHRVVALDARTGERKWTFITGSTVDSPPTLHKGMALFGSHDGWVYALRASDGELAWKFRAAPRERRIPVDGQLESPWPVPGSVLVEGSTLYFCAGRHSDTDGGLFLYAADPVTGVLKWDKHVDRDALMAIKLRGGFNLPKTINDVLTSDGKLLYLSTVQFDLATGDVVEKPAGHRIIAWPFGMLDDPNYGISRGAGHDGQLKEVVSTARVWRYSSNTSFYVGLGLFASAGQNLSVSGNNVYGIFRTEIYKKPHKVINLSIDHYAFADTVTGVNKSERKWRTDLAFRTAASVHAGDHVAVAGYEEETSQGMLCILDADSGKKVAEMPLKGRPIHCGLAAAADRLYLNLKEGTLICFGE